MEVKKLQQRPPAVAAAAGNTKPATLQQLDAAAAASDVNNPHPGLFLTDEISRRDFLVDTGAFKSIFPATSGVTTDCRNPIQLVAANGTPIRTYGERKILRPALPVDLYISRRSPATPWSRFPVTPQPPR